MVDIIRGIISLLIILLFSPMLIGLINKQKNFFTGRIGAPVLQPYYELYKLLRKETINSDTSSLISVIAPVINISTVIVAALMVPIGFFKPIISFEGDIILFAYILGLSRFFQILAAMDIGSSFEGMGAAREATFAVFVEPIFFFTIGSIAYITGFSSIYKIFYSIQPDNLIYIIFIVVCSISLFILMVTECSRMPVDDPNTHLELTMIHEVMILDNSGLDLFLYQYSSYIKLFIYVVLESSFLYPIGAQRFGLGLAIFLIAVLLFSTILAVVETVTSRYKMKYIPQYLLFGTAIGVLNILIYTFTG